MMTSLEHDLVTRTDVELHLDPSRVLARLFVPGQELAHDTESRASGVLHRILALPEEVVAASVADLLARFGDRHRDVRQIWLRHFQRVVHRVPDSMVLTDERRLLVGASFTNEYSVEAAALFNPSIVPHPDQSGLRNGQVRFVLSLRAVGEGHISSLEFRSGIAGPGNDITIDAPGRWLDAGEHRTTLYSRELFRHKLQEEGADAESSSFLLQHLERRFDQTAFHKALTALGRARLTFPGGAHTDELARRISECNYDVVFGASSPLDERILWPHAHSESQGIEDARFVRFTGADGATSYLATYTAFNGADIAPQLITTDDFVTFHISELAGPAAKNKGMALFPRLVNGRHVALSRCDRESSAVATSDDGLIWDEPVTIQSPQQPWELIQLGNAGSPIETDAGWLVITHAVGPMRAYSLGAILLDLDDPTHVLATLTEPLLQPAEDEREGYVPNVVYSCGVLQVGEQLLLPYGVSDSSIRFAYVDLPGLLKRLGDEPAPARLANRRS
ncbi:MAG: hypothetical protein JWM93_2936 [Frankiales bacterium]|nr:hypothetical protein [Frankiales bacterium]